MESLIKSHDFIKYRKNKLYIDKVSYNKVLSRYDTPVILFSKNTLIKNIKDISRAFRRYYQNTSIHYALKANYLRIVNKIIRDNGLKVEILSDMEYYYCRALGYKNSEIIFNGCAKTDNELKLVIKNNIKCINCDSYSEIKRINDIARELRKRVNIGMRVHPNVKDNTLFVERGEKLGIDIDSGEAIYLVNKIKRLKAVNLIGINCHILSKENSPEKHTLIAEKLCRFYHKLKLTGINIQFIDIGGGLNSNFLINKSGCSIDCFAKEISKVLNRNGFKGELIIEPGRYIVNDAFSILTKIITKKKSVNNVWILVDAATNILIPTKHNRFYPVSCRKNQKYEKANVGDGIGSTSGIIKKDTMMYAMNENDYVLILNAGAYTLSMSENFVYPKPKVIMIDGDTISVISKGTKISDFIRRVY